jgi:hypothetical protein
MGRKRGIACMIRDFVFFASAAVTVLACASGGPRPISVSDAERARCAGVADSVAKYVSTDALPFAHLAGNPRVLPAPPALRRGDSVLVEFVVRPDGLADPGSMEISGPNDPSFAQSVVRFMTSSSFIPGRMNGCNVPSRYNLVVKPAG